MKQQLLFLSLLALISFSPLQSQNKKEIPHLKATIVQNQHLTLGEGSVYDARRKILYWIDIENGKLFSKTDGKEKIDSFSFGKKIGTVVPTDIINQVSVALEDGIYIYDLQKSRLTLVCSPEAGKKGNRFNDGKCSPAGNFWVGSMSMNGGKNTGALYRVRSNGQFTKMIDSVGTSNGIVWNAEHTLMYYIDTPTSEIMQYEYNEEKDTIINPRVCIKIPKSLGYPDGMSIDSEGNLWVAHWSGSGIYKWNPKTGDLLAKVDIPAKNVTSCAFAGKDLKDLYITTARIGNSPNELMQSPQAGGLFIANPGVAGIEANYFKLKTRP